eukprot:EG_transcript_16080
MAPGWQWQSPASGRRGRERGEAEEAAADHRRHRRRQPPCDGGLTNTAPPGPPPTGRQRRTQTDALESLPGVPFWPLLDFQPLAVWHFIPGIFPLNRRRGCVLLQCKNGRKPKVFTNRPKSQMSNFVQVDDGSSGSLQSQMPKWGGKVRMNVCDLCNVCIAQTCS